MLAVGRWLAVAYLIAGCGRIDFDVQDGSTVDAKTCRDLQRVNRPTGSYPLAGRNVWCEQDRRGGGWTLALKIDGASPTFLGTSSLWDSTVLVNETSLDPAVLDEAKLAPYVDEPVAEIMVVIDGSEDATMHVRGSNLRGLLRSGLTVPSPMNEVEWRTAFSPGYLQAGCRRQGLGITNAPTGGPAHQVRIGVLANNEADECETSDSALGVGLELPCLGGQLLAAGSVSSYQGAPEACQPHRVDVYVRGDDQTRFASQPSCKAHLDLGHRDDGVYLVGGTERRCDMTTDGGGWTNALDFDGARDPCPTPWVAESSDVHICVAPGLETIAGVVVPSPIGTYREVMTAVSAYQRASTDAFHPPVDIDDTYVDGLSITAGLPRQHLATFASGYSDRVGCGGAIGLCNCPCLGGTPPPGFVAAGAFRCEAGTLSTPDSDILIRPDPLFDGAEAPAVCTDEASPEPIRTTLPVSTSADLEARLLRDEPTQGEGLAIYRLAIWVR